MLHTFLYFLALASLSSAPNWAKLSQMPIEILGFYRLSIASALLLLWIFIKKPNIKFNFNKTTWWVIASGVLFFLHLWTYKYAAKNTSVSNTMIIFSSNPIWASIGAIIFFNEKLHKRLIVSYSLALLGIYLLVANDLKLHSSFGYGDWSSLLSAILYSAHMLVGKKARQYYTNTYFAFLQYSVSAFLFGLCALGTGAQLTGYSDVSWLSVAGLILLPTFLGHFSLTYLVQYMDLSLMTCGKLIEPVLASIMAYALFNEKISPNAWISFGLTSLSVLILFSPSLFRTIKKYFHR